jgi:hypothetical protein
VPHWLEGMSLVVTRRKPELCSRSRRRLLLTRTSPTCPGVENVNMFNTIDREVVLNRM